MVINSISIKLSYESSLSDYLPICFATYKHENPLFIRGLAMYQIKTFPILLGIKNLFSNNFPNIVFISQLCQKKRWEQTILYHYLSFLCNSNRHIIIKFFKFLIHFILHNIRVDVNCS